MIAVAGSLGGALVLGVVAFAVLVAIAPARQRDEARAVIATDHMMPLCPNRGFKFRLRIYSQYGTQSGNFAVTY